MSGWFGGGRDRGVPAAARAVTAVVVALALAGAVQADAATLGGATGHALGAATAATARIPAVTLQWSGAPSAAGWIVDGVRVTSEGAPFAAGDAVELTVAPAAGRAGAPCEVRTAPAAETAAVRFDAGAFAACGALPYDALGRVAVAISGERAAAGASSLGAVRAALTSYSGGLRSTARTLEPRAESVTEGGVSFLARISFTVRGATADDLVGERLDVALLGADGAVRDRIGGVVSSAADAPVRVVTGGDAPVVVVDARAGRAPAEWPRTADVARFSALLAAPQRLGASASPPPVSLAAGVVERPAPRPGSALDAVDPDPRLAYAYPTDGNYTNGLAFCHTFTVRNTSSQAVRWQLAFDTSLPPLWGLDPTRSGALASQWGFRTRGYDPATHLWTIEGTPGNAVIPPGQSVSGLGYCAEDVPQPPVDPTSFTTSISLVPGGTDNHVQLRIQVRSDRRWNVPWEVTVDLADHVCAASLTGRTVTFSRVQATPVPGSSTAYVLRGTAGDTQYVSASQPRDVVFASYAPGGPGWAPPCR